MKRKYMISGILLAVLLVLCLAGAAFGKIRLGEGIAAQTEKTGQPFGNRAVYQGVLYTSDFKELVDWPEGCMAEEIAENGGIVTPDMFHPSVEIIREGSLDGLKDAEIVVFPWGLTHLKDVAADAVNIVPDTLLEVPSYQNGEYAGHKAYISHAGNSSREEPLGILDKDSGEWANYEYPWYEYYERYYDLQKGWNVFPNGKIYYLYYTENGMETNSPRLARGWKGVNSIFCYFDETGALTGERLREGVYELNGITLIVDADGNVSSAE